MLRFRHIIICLLLGIATSIALAVLLAAFRPVPMYPRRTVGVFEQWGRPWNISEVSPVGVHDIWWMDLNADVPGPTDELVRAHRRQIDERPATLPPTRIRHSPPSWGTFRAEEPRALIGSDTAFGFPVPCLWYEVVGRTTVAATGEPAIDSERLEGGFVLRGEASCRLRGFAAVPYRALWGRVGVDAVIWGVVWWVLIFVPRVVRGRLRRARGRCVVCGYELRDLVVCPECGARRR